MAHRLVLEALVLVLIFSSVPLAASAATGFIASLLQAVTQLQEQTISFVVKFFTLCLVIACAGEAALQRLVSFTRQVFAALPQLGG